MVSVSRFSLREMHSSATSMCLMQNKVFGKDADIEGNYKKLFKFLTEYWRNVLK